MSYLFKQLCLSQYWKAYESFPILYYKILKKCILNVVHIYGGNEKSASSLKIPGCCYT